MVVVQLDADGKAAKLLSTDGRMEVARHVALGSRPAWQQGGGGGGSGGGGGGGGGGAETAPPWWRRALG